MQLSEYIQRLGVDKIAETFNVTAVTVRSWRNLETIPKPDKAHEIINHTGNIVTWESIYAPYFAANEQKNA